jgi:hypothetical protein
MRMRMFVAFVAILIGLAGPLRSDNPPSNANPVDQLAWMVGGKWTAEGDKGPDGKPFHVETKFSLAENHRGILFTTWFLIDGKLVPTYEGIYAWQPAEKKFKFLYTDNEGTLTEGTAAWESDALEQEFEIVEPDGAAHTFRSTVKRTGPDDYDWNVRQQGKDGAWVVLFGLKYKRKPA